MNSCKVCGIGKGAVWGAIMFLAASTMGADLLYENDFAERRSDAAPHSVWATYEYDKGGPLAYDFDSGTMSDRYTGMYPWQGTASGTVPYSQQDGWFKKTTGYSRYANRGRTSVTVEADPALVHSSIEVNASVPVTNTSIIVYHPLHNVFTNGIIKLQFDIRQPVAPTGKIYSWLRLVTENDLKNDNNSYDKIPIELGLSSTTFSGGWRKNGDADSTRTFYSRSGAIGGHWYRYYVTCDIDNSRSSFEVYDLGTERISMDAMPSGTAPAWSGSNLLFVKELDAATGGINGIGIRLAYVDTKAYYGETGFDDDAAYKYDNIKVAWKAPAASSFAECYRNDFAKSMRRTIDGSDSTSHTYALAEQMESSTFTYPAELVRAVNVGTPTGTPYLPAASNGVVDVVQKAGIDGWRFVGQTGGFTGAIALTTNGANRVGMLTKYCQIIQPMCEDITNGLVKMEWDMRMPKAWNTGSARASIILTNNKGYDEGYAFAYGDRPLTLGICSATGAGNKDAPVKTYSIWNSTATSHYGTYNSDWASKFTSNHWYRIQLFMDLDKTNYWFHVYDVGSSAPSSPGGFDSSNPATALVSSVTNGLYEAGLKKHGLGIGAYGFVMWNNPDSDAGYAILVDNIRCWKGDGNDGWDLVFQNTFSTTTRNFKRKSLNLQKQGYIDRPEYGEDGWSFMPTYNFATRLVGANPALEGGDNIFSIVHPLGRRVKSGKLYAQYDMRIPVFWTSRMNYFWLQFGDGAIASASTWTSPKYRQHSHRTIRTGMMQGSGSNGALVDSNGVRNRTAIILQDGTGAGGDGSTKAKHVNGAYVGHWIRMKLEADMNAKT